MDIDEKLLTEKTAEFAAQRPAYLAYAAFLKEALARACQRFAPGSFVEARAKTPASFAEKIVRKQYKFGSNPNYDITDRCGARVIVQSAEDAGDFLVH